MRTRVPDQKKYHEDFYYHAVKLVSDHEREALYCRSPYQIDMEQPVPYGLLVPSGATLPDYAYAIRNLEHPKYRNEITIGVNFPVPRSPESLDELVGPIALLNVTRMIYGFEAVRQKARVPYRQIGDYTRVNMDNLRLHLRTRPKLLNAGRLQRNPWNGRLFLVLQWSDLDYDPPIVISSTIPEVHRLSKALEDRRKPEDWLELEEERLERIARNADAGYREKIASKFRHAPSI